MKRTPRDKGERKMEDRRKTYREAYEQCTTYEELKKQVKTDLYIAKFLGNNPDRIKAIEIAATYVCEQRGWSDN